MSTAPQVRPKPNPTRIGGKPVPQDPTVVEIDPVTASAWLQRNTHNRNLREGAVATLARDMAAGRWQYTGEAIKFSGDGTLLDGQHRLAAIIRSETTQSMLVVPGLPSTAQDVMDTGTLRTAGDALSLRDEVNANTLAAAVRCAINYEQGRVNGGRKSAVTHSEILDWLAENGDMRAAVTAVYTHKAIPLPASTLAFCVWRLRRADRDFAEGFFADLHSMRTEGRGDPRAALLQRLNGARTSREQLSRGAQISLVFRAWNAARRGQPVAQLKVSYNGESADIPAPI